MQWYCSPMHPAQEPTPGPNFPSRSPSEPEFASIESFVHHVRQRPEIREAIALHEFEYQLRKLEEVRTGLAESKWEGHSPNPSFVEMYDPAMPTLGILLPSGFEAATLFAVAAQRIPAGPNRLNIVFIPTLALEAARLIRSGPSTTLLLDSGILVNGLGQASYHEFQPIEVTAVADFRVELTPSMQKLHQLGVKLLNPPEVLELCYRKHRSKEWLSRQGFRTPPALHLTGAVLGGRDAVLEETVHQFLRDEAGSGFVVKPDDESGGVGVHIYLDEPADTILETARRSVAEFGSAIIEKRVPSFPCIDPEGRPVDWNVRILLAGGHCCDMEVRISEPGTPGKEAHDGA